MKPLEPHRTALLKAADILEQQGWCQREARDADGRHCLMGALAAALGPKAHNHTQDDDINFCILSFTWDSEQSNAWRCARVLLKDEIRADSLATWNDAKDRTKEEVIDMLRRAAIRDL